MRIYPLLRPFLFRLPAERAHAVTLQLLRMVGALPPLGWLVGRALPRVVSDPVGLCGLRFANRVGLAAGYDKDASAWRGLARMGFGHLELGTVTPQPQTGNPRPRVFRLVADRAVVNRLGFPSQGMEAVARRLRSASADPGRRPVLGVNIGKQKTTPLVEAPADYRRLFRRLAPLADYVAVNLSSPNTPDLRLLQGEEYLSEMASALVAEREELEGSAGRRVPLFFKLSPDISDADLEVAVGILEASGVDGIIATNTTVERSHLHSPRSGEKGGLSGAPLAALSTRKLARIADLTGGRLPLIAVGGILSADDARRKLDAGASLVQLYTGLVYRGPVLVSEVARSLAAS